MITFTFFVGQVLEGILKRCHIAIADKEAIDEAVEKDKQGEGFAKGQYESGNSNTQDCNQGDNSVSKSESFEIAEKHANIGEDNGDGVDDRQLANAEVGLSWVDIYVPW